jgi:hypothetical protein
VPNVKKNAMTFLRSILGSSGFVKKHKLFPNDFTRLRKLPFATIFALILRNSVKSLQLMLNEFVLQLKIDGVITASAFSQARKKLKHTAFMEISDGLVSIFYRDKKEVKKINGLRAIGCDGSILVLPMTEETKQVFGTRAIGNHCTDKELGEYVRTTFEAHYDVLNHVAIKTVLAEAGNCYETDLAIGALDSFGDDDLLIYDRGYAGYPFLVVLNKKEKKYLIRCSKGSFAAAQAMFEDGSPMSLITPIPDKDINNELKK